MINIIIYIIIMLVNIVFAHFITFQELCGVIIYDYITPLRPFGDENLPKGKFCLNVPRL